MADISKRGAELKIKNHDIYFFDRLQSENSAAKACNAEFSSIVFPDYSTELHLPSALSESSVVKESEIKCDAFYYYENDQNELNIHFYKSNQAKLAEGAYEGYLTKISTAEMTQNLGRADTERARIDLFRHISHETNIFHAFAFIKLENISIILELQCPNSRSKQLLEIFTEIANSAKEVPRVVKI